VKLSEHFTLAEFMKSDAAARMGINNEPTAEHLENLKATAFGMEQVRSILGDRAIIMTSGYRNPAVNKAVGGVANSDHAQGWAVDFHHATLTDLQAARVLAASGLVFDQLILERGRCVHISFNPRGRQQVLSQHGGPGTAVIQGIVP
jgi:putative chitinase